MLVDDVSPRISTLYYFQLFLITYSFLLVKWVADHALEEDLLFSIEGAPTGLCSSLLFIDNTYGLERVWNGAIKAKGGY